MSSELRSIQDSRNLESEMGLGTVNRLTDNLCNKGTFCFVMVDFEHI